MKDYQKKANEHFFDKILLSLNKGGKYVWIEKQHIFSKYDNKLFAHTKDGYKDIKGIVSKKYFRDKIRLLNSNQTNNENRSSTN